MQTQAQLPLAQANLDGAKAQVGVAQATSTNADTNLKRDQDLARMGSLALSRQQLDNDTATARSDAANLAAAQQKVAASEAQLALNKTQIATAEANVRAAAAQVEQARLNLSYTQIRASIAGRVVGGFPGPIYSAAKHGVVAMSHSINMQECINGIRSTVFLPGEVATPILDKRPNPVGPEERARMVQSEDCGDLIRYIACLPKHVVMNEVHLAPTHNRGYLAALQRQL